jgi:UDP-glucose 4-epimerase
MRVVVTGATGNVGVPVVRALAARAEVDEVVGLARRTPPATSPLAALADVTWTAADVVADDLTAVFRGADAVVHLTWLIQPSRDLDRLWQVNVEGTVRVLEAIERAGVGAFVHASSVGAYSPGPKDRRGRTFVDESWPTHGIATSAYSREKAYTERLLDAFEERHPSARVVRLRPALIFRQGAASRIRRLFLGSFAPNRLLAPGRLPVVPTVPGLRFQAVHTDDVATAYAAAVVGDVRGAFNLAAEPVLTLDDVATVLGARTVPVPSALVRAGVRASFAARLHPVEPGWYDLARSSPLLDTARATRELGWTATRSATDTLRELLTAIAAGRGGPTPALEGDEDRGRIDELATGQGAREAEGTPGA